MAVIIVTTEAKPAMDHLDRAWGLIANAYGGDWSQASPEWHGAAVAWRDRYHKLLDEFFDGWEQARDRRVQEVFGPY